MECRVMECGEKCIVVKSEVKARREDSDRG